MIDYELGVIGAGNMAMAILRGVVKSGCLQRDSIVAYDPVVTREQMLAIELGILCARDNSMTGSCPHVLIAVKPNIVPDVLDEIKPIVKEDSTIISIAAGVTTAFIDERLDGKGRIVRVMPNTPMLVGSGMSAIAAGPRATNEDVHWTQRLFSASGLTVVMKEDLMDAVTAVSGSGPAYFFYLIEAMTAAGVAEGIDPEVAEMLATRTCIGAGQLLAETRKSPEDLRRQVTTPGGTTERALTTMDGAGMKETLVEAVRAAAERSRELGK